MESKDTSVNLPAVARKGFGRDGQWSVTVAGLTGYGRSLTKARESACDAVSAYLASAGQSPAFASDDDGSLIVVIPDGTGVTVYRVKDTESGMRATMIASGAGTPSEVVERTHHYAPIPTR